MLIQIRISLPDRPGALGQAGRITGAAGADIVRMQVLSRATGRALDDLYLCIPDRTRVAALVADLQTLPGVRVHGVRESDHLPGAHPDLDLLGYVLRNPGRGLATLVDMAPAAFAADWAALQHRTRSRPTTVYTSTHCPDPPPISATVPRRTTHESIRDMRLALSPLGSEGLVLVLGRTQGPAFHPIELSHLTAVVELVLIAGVPMAPADLPPYPLPVS